MKSKIIDAIPDDMTIEEASEFWDTHKNRSYIPCYALLKKLGAEGDKLKI